MITYLTNNSVRMAPSDSDYPFQWLVVFQSTWESEGHDISKEWVFVEDIMAMDCTQPGYRVEAISNNRKEYFTWEVVNAHLFTPQTPSMETYNGVVICGCKLVDRRPVDNLEQEARRSLVNSWKPEFLGSNPLEISIFIEGDKVGYAAGGDTPGSGSIDDPELAFEVWKEEGFKYFYCFQSKNNFFKTAQIASFNPIPDRLELFITLGLNGRSPASYLQKPDTANILFFDEYAVGDRLLKINYLG